MPSHFSHIRFLNSCFSKEMTAKWHVNSLLVSSRFSSIRLKSSSRFSNIRLKWGYRVLVRCITKTRQASDWSSRYRVPSRFSKTPKQNSHLEIRKLDLHDWQTQTSTLLRWKVVNAFIFFWKVDDFFLSIINFRERCQIMQIDFFVKSI